MKGQVINIYKLPYGLGDLDQLRRDAQARRKVLRQAGLTTYTIGLRDDLTCIVCLCCGLGSFNPNDVEERFCGFCNRFHDDVPTEEEKQ